MVDVICALIAITVVALAYRSDRKLQPARIRKGK